MKILLDDDDGDDAVDATAEHNSTSAVGAQDSVEGMILQLPGAAKKSSGGRPMMLAGVGDSSPASEPSMWEKRYSQKNIAPPPLDALEHVIAGDMKPTPAPKRKNSDSYSLTSPDDWVDSDLEDDHTSHIEQYDHMPTSKSRWNLFCCRSDTVAPNPR